MVKILNLAKINELLFNVRAQFKNFKFFLAKTISTSQNAFENEGLLSVDKLI